jgi:hypothetical protein
MKVRRFAVRNLAQLRKSSGSFEAAAGGRPCIWGCGTLGAIPTVPNELNALGAGAPYAGTGTPYPGAEAPYPGAEAVGMPGAAIPPYPANPPAIKAGFCAVKGAIGRAG